MKKVTGTKERRIALQNLLDMQDRFRYSEPKFMLIAKMYSQHRTEIFQKR
jgi:hypothetical protein